MAYQYPEQQTSTIKPPARNPAASVPGVAPLPAITVPAGGDGVNPITKIVANLSPARDQYGNDMTRTNQMKAAMGEAPVGTTAAPAAPAVTSPAPVVRDQYGNDMTATNAMKKQLGEAPIGSPAASVPGLPARDAVQTRGYVATQAGQMNPAMERVINAQPNQLLASVLNGKQTAVPQITGTVPVQNVGPATPGKSAGPQANPIALAAQATVPALLAAKVTNPPAGPQSLPSTTPIADQAATATAAAPEQGPAANPLASINLQANNDSLARANTIRQQMIDGDGQGPKVTMLENSGLKETQELMDKWGRQDMQREMLQEMSRNPRAANAIAGLAANANNTEAQLRGQDFAAQDNQRNTATTQRGQDLAAETARRGQDVNAATDAHRLAGNPLDNELKRVQVQTGQTALDRAKANEAAIEAIQAEKDPAKRQSMIESLLVAQGKNPLADRYIKVDGGEYTDAMGNKIKAPSGIYDAVTQQLKPMTPETAAAPTYEQFSAQMKARYPGKVTDDQLKAAFATQYGSK